MNKTGISYLDFTWNPVTGCSYGCPECWARGLAKRFGWSFEPTLHPERLNQPLKRKKPSTIGVCFMGDLFDDDLADYEFYAVSGQMLLAPWHTYVLLTKRAANIKTVFVDNWRDVQSNWFLGVTVRNQSELDAAAPHIRALQQKGWSVWLSIEPMQGPVSFAGGIFYTRPSGIILGGQSGPGAKPLDLNHVRAVRDQCAAAGVPFMFKQGSGIKPEPCPLLDGVRHTALPWEVSK